MGVFEFDKFAKGTMVSNSNLLCLLLFLLLCRGTAPPGLCVLATTG